MSISICGVIVTLMVDGGVWRLVIQNLFGQITEFGVHNILIIGIRFIQNETQLKKEKKMHIDANLQIWNSPCFFLILLLSIQAVKTYLDTQSMMLNQSLL